MTAGELEVWLREEMDPTRPLAKQDTSRKSYKSLKSYTSVIPDPSFPHSILEREL